MELVRGALIDGTQHREVNAAALRLEYARMQTFSGNVFMSGLQYQLFTYCSSVMPEFCNQLLLHDLG